MFYDVARRRQRSNGKAGFPSSTLGKVFWSLRDRRTWEKEFYYRVSGPTGRRKDSCGRLKFSTQNDFSRRDALINRAQWKS